MTNLLSRWPGPLYLVGGAVRDSLLGLPVKDRDVCSALLPIEVMLFCKENGIKCELTNESHLVVTMWLNGEAIEHTTFRRESAYDGVHAGLVEPSNQEEDAHRRDLSINALYQEWGSGEVVDLVGGLQDLENRVLRLISSDTYGNEFSRLWEHGGRLFRLARFASSKFKCHLSISPSERWTIHADTLKACQLFAPIALNQGRAKWESFGEEWAKADYCLEYLQVLDTFHFLSHYGLKLPSSSEWSSKYPWYSLWVSSGKPDLRVFQSQWKVSKDVILSIKDLEIGKGIEHEWEWRTTEFRRLSALDVANHWNKHFRVLDIPTQGDVANEVGPGPHVMPEWVKRVRAVYE